MLTAQRDFVLQTQAEPSEIPSPLEQRAQLRIPAALPFFWLALAALCGPLGAEYLQWPAWGWLLLAAAAALPILTGMPRALQELRRVKLPAFPLPLLAAALAFTAALYMLSLPGTGPQALAFYHESGPVTLRVLVTQAPAKQAWATALTVQALSLRGPDGQEVQAPRGKLLVQTQSKLDFRYGDLLIVRGELEAPPEGSNFSYRSYLAHKGVYSYLSHGQVTRIGVNAGNPLLQALDGLRSRGADVLDAIFPHPENALLRGILLGDESAIPKALKDAYALTGTAHVIAISGFNMAILAGVVARLFQKRLGPYIGLVLTILVLWLYSLLVGASASVLRAAIMGCVAALGASIGRRGSGLNALGFSIVIMLILDPHLPWDIGFQLSAMATLGLLLFAGPAHARVEFYLAERLGETKAARLAKAISEIFLLTLIAQGMVMPLLAFHFRSLSPLFLIANPLILPLQGAVMIMGLLAMLGGLVYLPLGKLLAWVAWIPAWVTNQIVARLAVIMPQSLSLPRFSFLWVLLVYALGWLILIHQPRVPLRKKILSPSLILPLLALLSGLVWMRVAALPNGRLELRLRATEASPLVYMRLPEGQTVLLGSRLPARQMAETLARWAPALDPKLDLLLIPACKAADLRSYTELPGQLRIKEVLFACDPGTTLTGQKLTDLFASSNIPITRLEPHAEIKFSQAGAIVLESKPQGLQSLALNYAQANAFFALGDQANPTAVFELTWAPGPSSAQTPGGQLLYLPSSGPAAARRELQPLPFSPGRELRFGSDGATFLPFEGH